MEKNPTFKVAWHIEIPARELDELPTFEMTCEKAALLALDAQRDPLLNGCAFVVTNPHGDQAAVFLNGGGRVEADKLNDSYYMDPEHDFMVVGTCLGDENPELPCCYVTVYGVTRHYGGPEEGGWWYNWYRDLCSIPLVKPGDRAEILEIVRFLKTKFKDEDDIYSVRGGVLYEFIAEVDPGRHATKERPRYD